MVALPQVVTDDAVVKPFGLKAATFIRRPPIRDARLTVLEGAVRSSKTWAMIPKFLELCNYDVRGRRVITGVSKQTIYNNILSDLFDLLGPANYTYNRQSGELDVMGTKWLTIGAKDEGSEKYVRGLTVGCWYGDELTLQPESFVMMILNRMSPDNARGYATTNPDNPYHYVKTRILDNQELLKAGNLNHIHFTLDDNPNLSEDYKRFLEQSHKGMFYLRYVKGLWVVAEGAIYGSCWSNALLYDDDERPKLEKVVERYVGVDCGVDHPQVYLDVWDDGETLWVDREYFWDSHETLRQKTDSEYADDLEEFLKEAPGAQVIIPPEVASFRAELVQRGIWFTDAENEVYEGIHTVSTLMAQKRIRFSRTRTPHCQQEFPSYSWDPKKSMRGLEEPIKKKDDTCDCGRYVAHTKVKPWRLMHVTA